MDKLKDLNEIKHSLIDAVKAEIAKGIDNVNTDEMGEVIDMIKDLASAEKDCMEASFYEVTTEAMTEGEDRAGYDNWRYSSGRFAPKGRGHRSGYMPPYMDGMDRMNYTPTTTPDRTADMRYGYTPTDRMGHMKPSEKLDKAIDTMGDIWAESDHDTRVKMKSLVAQLMEQMEQSGV